MPTFDSQVKFQKIPVSQLVVEQAATASAPASPLVGQLWFDTTVNQLKVCTNATGPVWTQCDNVTGGTAGNVADGDKGEITISSGVWTIDNNVVSAAKIVNGTITDTQVATANKDGVAGTASLRTLGTGAQQAVSGTDARLSDQRVPTDNSVTSAKIADGTIAVGDLAAALKENGVSGGTAAVSDVALRRAGYLAGDAMPGNSDLGTQSMNVPVVNNLDVNNFYIANVPTPAVSHNAANKQYVDTEVAGAKTYADSVAQGLDAKASVKAATTVQIALNGAQTIDGIAVTTGDRVLVKAQTNPNNNGIYVASTSGWPRATDSDAWTDIPGSFVFVEQGTLHADTGWVCTADQGGTLGSTAITWTQFSSAGQYTGGNGLTLTGTDFSVNVDNSGIEITADTLKLKDGGVTQTRIGDGAVTSMKIGAGAVFMDKMAADTKDQVAGTSSMRSLGTGATQAAAGSHGHALTDAGITGILSTAKGGTGADASTGAGQTTARANLGVRGHYATNSPALTAGVWATITHNLGARARDVTFEEITTGEGRFLDWRVNAINALTQVDIRCDIVGGRAASYYSVNVAA